MFSRVKNWSVTWAPTKASSESGRRYNCNNKGDPILHVHHLSSLRLGLPRLAIRFHTMSSLISSLLWPVLTATTMIVAVALLVSTGIILYRLFLHPLAKVPWPRLAAISNVWQAYQARNGQMLTLAKTLHRKYGHAVRVGPNEVWFDSQEAFKIIYSVSTTPSCTYIVTHPHRAFCRRQQRI